MPNYNQDLQQNNTELDQILQTVNNLPEAGGGSYTLPTASKTQLGGVKVGSGLNATTEGVLSSDNSYVDNNFANAIKDTLTGKAIATDMVSPVEHDVKCRVESKNLFDISKLKGGLNGRIRVENSDIIVSGSAANPGDGTVQKLRDLCTGLEVGAMYTLSATSTAAPEYQKIIIGGKYVNFGESFTLTEDMLNAYIFFYSGTSKNGDKIISNFQIEKGSVATPYSPYISDKSKVKLNRYGGNLLPFPFPLFPVGNIYKDAGVTFKALDNGGIHITGYLTTANAIFTELCHIDLGKTNMGTTRGDKAEDTNGEFVISKYLFYRASDKTLFCNLYNETGITWELDEIIYPQANIGTKLFKYDKYSELDYTPLPDGTVKGMTSLSPNMTILTDNPDVNIEATYNADTKKYIDKKFAELQSAIVTNV